MRLYKTLVFDQMVRGTSEVVSPPEFQDDLGKADDIAYEVEVEDAGGTSPTISIRHLESNSGKAFGPRTNLITDDSLDNLPYRQMKVQEGPLGGLGQVGVTLGGTNPWARVRIWACGRSK